MPINRREALGAATAASLVGAAPARAVDARAESSDLVLWYERPAQAWTEALPVGNGRLGAMVFGGLSRERLQLNEDSLWAGGPYQPANPDARAALPRVRDLVFAGDYAAAEELANQKLMGRPMRQMSYQTVGDLRLEFPGLGAPSAYRRDLDLDGALATTRFTHAGVQYRREVFATSADDLIVVRLSASRPGALDLDLGFHWPHAGKAAAPPSPSAAPLLDIAFEPDSPAPKGLLISVDGDGDLVMRGRNADQNGIAGALRYEARARVRAFGGSVRRGADRLSIRKADEILILVAIATSHRNFRREDADPSKRNLSALRAADGKAFAALLADHQRAHRRLFRRVRLDLGRTSAADAPTDQRIRNSATADDPALAALYFQYGRYLLISCSRPGGQPANLQGLWNDSLNPPWGGKYTININTEMNYWPAEPTGLEECVEPLIEMVKDLAVTGATTAQVMYGARGWVCHHNTDLWRATAPIDGAKYGVWPTGGAWLCLHLWDRYDYSRDRAYLAEIYPVLRGASEFFLETLQPHPNGRWMVTNPSMSPEHMHQPSVSICAGPTMDNQILRDLFAHTAKAAELLGRDAEFRERVLKTRGRLPPDQIGAQGQLQEWLQDWDMTAQDLHHRHVSHLYGLFPSGQISVDYTPTLAAAARRSLEIRGDMATGWGLAWRLNLWARLRQGDHAHRILALLLGPERTYPNMFDAHPPFQIDGNFGGTSGMTEMLLQSLKAPDGSDELLVLPALPSAWPTGSVAGLRGRGGVEIDIRWRDGRLQRLDLRARRAGAWRLRHGGSRLDVRLPAGAARSYSLEGDRLTAL